jgi:hypothetical protein
MQTFHFNHASELASRFQTIGGCHGASFATLSIAA